MGDGKADDPSGPMFIGPYITVTGITVGGDMWVAVLFLSVNRLFRVSVRPTAPGGDGVVRPILSLEYDALVMRWCVADGQVRTLA